MNSVFKNKFYKKKVLITGGCGFIGLNLANKLLNAGAIVSVFDLYVKPTLLPIKVIQGDITSPSSIDEAMRGIDYVFHLSAVLGVEKILNVPGRVLKVNLGGTINSLEAAVKNRVKGFLFTSSSEVYGEPQKIPIAEDDPIAPVSTYGVSKIAAEEYCQVYNKEYGLPVTRVRYFNIYGPGQSERFVVPIFINKIIKKESPVIYGDGNQYRSYTHVDDAVDGTLLAAANEKAIGEVFNIGNDIPLSIKDLASFIINLSGRRIEPIYKAFGDGVRIERREVKKRIPDISKARTVLNYIPKINWQEGIKSFFNWYLKNHGVIDA